MGLLAKLFGASKGAQNRGGLWHVSHAAFAPLKRERFLLIYDEERLNFADLLRHLQEWHAVRREKYINCSFHPEARALLWGQVWRK